MIALRAAHLYTPIEHIAPALVLVEGGLITAVLEGAAPPAGAQVIDAELVAPGFVDLQLNGAFGHDFAARPEGALEAARLLPETGVTSFLPTLISLPRPRYPALLQSFRSLPAAPGAARLLGVHLEGPFLSPARAGAHQPSALATPDAADLGWMLAGGVVKLVTLAPELPGATAMIGALTGAGIAVSLGHTDATFEELQAALAAGARLATHLFNAMPPLHHRRPGGALAALLDERCAAAIIADGVHLHPAAVQLVQRLKRPPSLVLVTDAISALGQGVGPAQLAGRDVFVDATSARLADGTLAGSVLTMDAAVRNLRAFTGCSTADALTAATLAPARALGLEQRLGRVAPGCDADLVLLDQELKVQQAMVRGVWAPRA